VQLFNIKSIFETVAIMDPWRILQGALKKLVLGGLFSIFLFTAIAFFKVSIFQSIPKQKNRISDIDEIKPGKLSSIFGGEKTIFGMSWVLFSDQTCMFSNYIISLNMTNAKIDLKCPMLTNIGSKTEERCLEEETESKELFKDTQFHKRMRLPSKQYFREFHTVAFQKVNF